MSDKFKEKDFFYTCLGVDKTASKDEIKRAYKKLAVKHHPDKNPGNKEAEEKFKEISAAYEVLSDDEKRQTYDQFGYDGLQGSGGFTNAEDLFGNLFGSGLFGNLFGGFGGGGGRYRGGPRKSPDIQHVLKLPLKDCYTGKLQKLKVSRKVVCTECVGKGTNNPDAKTQCGTCNGRGVKVTVEQSRPGFITQYQTTCPDCNGEGTQLSDEDKCKECSGKGTVSEKETVAFQIPPGAYTGLQLVQEGKADHLPGTTPGDLVVIVQEVAQDGWKRVNHDLVKEQSLPLIQALTGYELLVTHLDQRVLRLSAPRGTITKPGQLQVVKGEGMPHPNDASQHGDLYIAFQIEFPEQLSEQQMDTLTRTLPAPTAMDIDTSAMNVIDVKSEEHHRKEEDNHHQKASGEQQQHGFFNAFKHAFGRNKH